ncbi:MAG: response regulator [Planctomycetota bacterium]|jgi:DNA-binding NarL/FixJ family response regulator
MEKDGVVLIAEHNDEHFDTMKENLLRAGVRNQILRLPDGRQTLDYVSEISAQPAVEGAGQQYVLFIDVDLPEAGGVEVLEKIKADARLSKIPVIVLTAVDDPNTIDRCYDLGCSTYIVKPAKYEDFAEIIQNIGSFLSVVETTSIK